MKNHIAKITAGLVLLSFAGLAVGLPSASKALSSTPTIFHDLRAWWADAKYLGEQGVERQRNNYDCGVVSLRMTLKTKGIDVSIEELRRLAGTTFRGTSLLGLVEAARAYGLQAEAWKITHADLASFELPLIAFVEGSHYVVVAEVTPGGDVIALDPARGMLRYREEAFYRRWSGEALIFGTPGEKTISQSASQ